MKRIPFVAAAACILAAHVPTVSAKLPAKLQKKVAETVEVLNEFVSTREVPLDLLQTSECVMVMPDVGKGALIVGGMHGKGLASCRLESGSWSAPVFMEISEASIGLQAGGASTDMLFAIRDDHGAEHLLKSNFKLGADAAVAAGPHGRETSASTDATLKTGILVWARSEGAFLGVSVDGASITQDTTDNKKLYGREIDPKDILMPAGAPVPVPADVQSFVTALERLTVGSNTEMTGEGIEVEKSDKGKM